MRREQSAGPGPSRYRYSASARDVGRRQVVTAEREGELAVAVRLVRQDPRQDRRPRVDLSLLAVEPLRQAAMGLASEARPPAKVVSKS